jgi:hypothetical protein
VEMRARVILKRNVGGDIALWVRDGGVEYAGREICYALKDMLESFSAEDVIGLLESVVTADKGEYSDMEVANGFELGDLDRFIYGHVDWFSDPESAADVVYVVDVYNQVVWYKGVRQQEAFKVLTLDGICNGLTFMDDTVLRKGRGVRC